MASAILEVQKYLSAEVVPRKEDPLLWWKSNKHAFPNLSEIVKQKCCMVATSVPCERLFSKAGNIINERRTRISDKKVNKLLFLKQNT